MAQVEGGAGDGGNLYLPSDILRKMLDRVDAKTLARVSCVSKRFRSISSEESFWENLCNQRWSSTREPSVKSLISSAGGFKKLYNNCFPFILSNSESTPSRGFDPTDRENSSPSSFMSIVDVTFNGKPVLSRVVNGIPGAWEPCGPLVDILDAATMAHAGHGVSITKQDEHGAVLTIYNKIPEVSSTVQECSDSPFSPVEFCNRMRVSWILINTKTQQMVNLSSWKPLSAVRHRPFSDDFLLRFGSILQTPSVPVHCNITMRCRTCTVVTLSHNEVQGHQVRLGATTAVKVTELSLHLENILGAHIRGGEVMSLLSLAITSDKTVDESKASGVYNNFSATQSLNREALIRQENRRQNAGAVFFVGIIVVLMSFLIDRKSVV